MPHIEKLPSGKFRARVRHPSGKRESKTFPLKGTARVWAAEREAEFARGAPVAAAKLTVGEWVPRWQRTRRVEAATAKKNASHLRVHVLPQWGTWPLQAVGRSDVQAWVNDMARRNVGPSTIHGAFQLFSAVMSDAVLERLMPASPCREIDLPKVVKPAPRWLMREEYDRIQLALAVTPRAPTWQAYVGLGCFSGLRPGELAGLDVGQVDLDRGLVRVGQVMTRHGLRAYGKTSQAARSVPFPDDVGRLLWRLLADRGAGPVFLSPRGGRVRDELFRDRVWAPALEAAGVEYARPYILRHTAASWLVQAGVPDREIMKILGHSSTALIATYAHLAPDAHEKVRGAWAVASSPTLRVLSDA
jgi:integrase